MAALSAVLMVTSGFGVQYLLWPLPLVVALSARWRLAYIAAAGGWAAAFYLSRRPKRFCTHFLAGMSCLPVTVLFLVVAEQVDRSDLTSVMARFRRPTPADAPGPLRRATALLAGSDCAHRHP